MMEAEPFASLTMKERFDPSNMKRKLLYLTFWRRIFFQILAHPVFKMSVIQKPNKVALWNKRHFEEKKMEIIQHVWNIQYGYLLNKYKMGHLEGNFTPVLYIGRKVPKGWRLIIAVRHQQNIHTKFSENRSSDSCMAVCRLLPSL